MREHWLLPELPYADYDEYRRASGADALAIARAMVPALVLEQVHRSGLRGRGGAGFPTGVKWRTLHQHPCKTRFVVCNAAEGEPGTFKDRWLLRRNPYACLEGLLIAAHVLGARQIYIGIKASFQPELARLRAALEELQQAGSLAGVEVHIVEGPEEYLFGEEKALLNFIEDGMPLPREAAYPPYERGLFATSLSPNPALVNNVETYAHVPSILRHGGASFRALGSHDTAGTVLLTLSGDVRRPGIYEVEAGLPLRTLLEEHGGGARHGEFKAVLSGVSSGVILPQAFDTPLDFGSLALIGSGLGSGGLIAFDETRSMPRVAQALARFLYVESCNQCSACKHGLRLAWSAIDELFDPGRATPDDIERALYGARSAPQANRCYLPVQGSVLIPSLVEAFRAEFEAQLADPSARSDAFELPSLEDFDEARGEFVYDPFQRYKQPDWTYDLPQVAPVPMHSVAAGEPSGPLGLQLQPEVLAALQRRAAAEGEAVDRLANRLLSKALDLFGSDTPIR
jgi:NADH-quinone oxidoreductase subunit F